MSWLVLQARRIRWLAQDLTLCLRHLARVRTYARHTDRPIAIALLEGGARATLGQPNAYRIRVANDTLDELTACLDVRGEAPHARAFATRVECTLAAGTSRELFLLTDWVARFEIAAEPAPPDLLAISPVPEGAETCHVTATLEASGRLLDRQVIAQPVSG